MPSGSPKLRPEPQGGVHDFAVLDPSAFESFNPGLQLGPTRAPECDKVQPGLELGEVLIAGRPIVLMDAEQRAVVECPDEMSEPRVGVLVEHWVGTDQSLVPGPLTPRSRTVSATCFEAPQAAACGFVEPMTGIEPAYSAWEADVLPLNYIGLLAYASDHEG